jgi:hypothetical protein
MHRDDDNKNVYKRYKLSFSNKKKKRGGIQKEEINYQG